MLVVAALLVIHALSSSMGAEDPKQIVIAGYDRCAPAYAAARVAHLDGLNLSCA
jgi:hypothetical protein